MLKQMLRGMRFGPSERVSGGRQLNAVIHYMTSGVSQLRFHVWLCSLLNWAMYFPSLSLSVCFCKMRVLTMVPSSQSCWLKWYDLLKCLVYMLLIGIIYRLRNESFFFEMWNTIKKMGQVAEVWEGGWF